MRTALRAVLEALFRVLFVYDCVGEENVPATGPAVVAANHPSYLDPVLLSLQIARPIHFMAWDALFRVPLVGRLIRLFGAFPVDLRRGQGHEAYARAKALVEAGEVVGIFPEGRRSLSGWMEPALRAGAARLAYETGAPLVPATIAGAFRAWPHFQFLPRPARIRVRYHEPIDAAVYRGLPEEQALRQMLDELQRRVDRSLLPGVKADLRTNVVYSSPAPLPRLHEWLPALALGAAAAWKHASWVAPAALAYVAYLWLDRFAIPQSRLAKRVRNTSPALFLLACLPRFMTALGTPPPAAPAALWAIVLGASFPYVYEKGRTALAFVRGLVIAELFALGAALIQPSPLGLHVAVAFFAAAFAWERTTVFWRYSAPVLGAYGLGVPLYLGGVAHLPLQVLCGLVAWLATRLLPDPPGVDAKPLKP